jgi:thioredoxin 2
VKSAARILIFLAVEDWSEEEPAMSDANHANHVVCPACGAINRVPGDRAPDAAKCGACKAGLFAGEPVAVDSASFDRHVARNDIPVLVDVWAPWCGPCRSMAPQFERAAQLLAPDVRLLKLNADDEPAVAARYGVQGIPALLLFKNGRLAAQTAGAMDATRLVDWTRSHL